MPSDRDLEIRRASRESAYYDTVYAQTHWHAVRIACADSEDGRSEPCISVSTFASHVDATVRVSGRVADVCQAKGCWMVITPEDTDDAAAMIRVTMKDHAFSVDKQGAGSVTQLEGVLKAVEVDAETVEHYASEGGAGDAVPEKQGMKYELVASAVQMKPGAAPQ